MVFSSITFLYYFLPVVLLLYAISPRKLKNTTLLISSLVFYGWGEPKYVLLLMFMAFVSWLCALGVSKGKTQGERKLWVISAAVALTRVISSFTKRKRGITLPRIC